MNLGSIRVIMCCDSSLSNNKMFHVSNFWQVDCKQGPQSDKDGFSALVKELSAAFKPKGLLLSAAVSPSKKVIDEGYDVPVLNQYLDYINVMTYDYYGHWDKQTGHVAPLYHHPNASTFEFNCVRWI